MTEHTSAHRGHELRVSGSAEAPRLSIDGEAIPVSRLAPDLYATALLPHTNFPSLDALGVAVIDHSPQFSGRRDRA
jgi:hypothetical protein